MKDRLEDKVALITGSSSGLGRAIAFAFAAEGALICCVDMYPDPRNPMDPETGRADSFHNRIVGGADLPTHLAIPAPPAGAEAEPRKREHVFVRADVTSAPSVEAAVEVCVAAFGRLDIMVNNAGISTESSHTRVLRAHETPEEEYDRTMAINAKGVFLGCKYAIAQMLAQEPREAGGSRGWIVNTASVQGFVGYWGTPAYCASKGAVVQLTRQIALDYGKDKIHCNAICPGFLKTAMTQNIQSEAEALRTINEAHPLGGMGNPEDVARAAVFLASDDARWVTGVPLPVDGGFLCQ